MLRSIALSAAALLLAFAGSAQACTCGRPPPLSCSVAKGSAALLVTFDCVKTVACSINDGIAVADVTIDRVFKDNTDLGLEKGDMATIGALLQGATCGIGGSFFPGAQWIMFLRSGSVASPFTEPPPDVFSDGSICNVEDSDLSTNLCAGNIQDPTAAQIEQLAEGCANPIVVTPPIFESAAAE